MEKEEEFAESKQLFFLIRFVLKSDIDISTASPGKTEIIGLEMSYSWIKIDIPSENKVLSWLISQTVLNETIFYVIVCLLLHSLVLILNSQLYLWHYILWKGKSLCEYKELKSLDIGCSLQRF